MLQDAQKRDQEEFLKTVKAAARREAENTIKKYEARVLKERNKSDKADKDTLHLNIKSEVKIK